MSASKGFLKSSTTIGLLTLVSRILGFARDILMAALFGTGMVADAFWYAFSIPNLFRRLFGEGTLNAAFIPVYTEKLHQDKDAAQALLHNVLTILLVALCITVGIGVMAAPWIVKLYGWGWRGQADKIALTIRLTRIMFPYLLFIALALLLGAALNSHRVFSGPALSPAVLNLTWAAGLVLFGYYWFTDPVVQISWVAGAVVMGGVGQFLLQVPYYRRLGLTYRSVINFRDPGLKQVVTLVIPGVFGLAVTQINIIVDRFLASFLAEGSVTALTLSNRLMLLPLSVFGISVATALLPSLSEKAAEKDWEGLADHFTRALDLIFFILLPVSALLMALAVPAVRLVFQYGRFTASSSTPRTACALLLYATGLFAYGGLKVTVQAFYALKDTRTPVKVAAVTLVLNIILNIILMRAFEFLAPGYGLGGLALATALSAMFNLFILSILLRKKVPAIQFAGRLAGLARSVVLAAVVGLSAWWVHRLVGTFITESHLTGRIVVFCISAVAGTAIWLGLAYLLKIKEIRLLFSLLKR